MISIIFKKIFYFKEFRIFNKLKNQRNFTERDKQNYQLEKLKTILKIALNIPYYNTYMKNINIEDISYSTFSEIPFLTKDDIRINNDTLIYSKYKNKKEVFENTSGGSTGEPVKFMKTKEQSYHGVGNYYYANFLNGITPNDRILVLWGAIRDMHAGSNRSILKRIKSFLLNSETLNTFILSKEIVSSYVDRINQFRPKVIKAYVHSLFDIARYINEKKLIIKCTPIIHTSTGPLYPEIKEEIKKAFNKAHVFSFYGSREVSAIATEIPDEEGMIVLYDNVLLEIIKMDGQPAQMGEEGEVVVTTLNNKYMPLIRYKIGDRAIKDDNFNTFGTLKIRSVLGRTLGVIFRKDGSYLDGQFFTTLFFNRKGIQNFQLIQKSVEILQLNLVINNDFDQKELDLIVNTIKNEIGHIVINVDYVDNINLNRSGKIMYVFSELAS